MKASGALALGAEVEDGLAAVYCYILSLGEREVETAGQGEVSDQAAPAFLTEKGGCCEEEGKR